MASKRREFKGERSSESLSRLELEKGQMHFELGCLYPSCGALESFAEHNLFLSMLCTCQSLPTDFSCHYFQC